MRTFPELRYTRQMVSELGGGANITLTNMAVAAQFFPLNQWCAIRKLDLTHFLQARMVVRVLLASTSVNTPKLRARYRTTAGTPAIGEFAQDLGVTEMSCSLAALGSIDTGWIDIASAAKADVWVAIEQIGGDADKDPVVGQVGIHFRGH